MVGLQGYAALDQLGTGAFTGFISAYFNTREIAPLVAGLALAATVGCGFTAQLGAMRITEEIDALEVMGVPSLPYLVTTRVIAGFLAVIPLYAIGLLDLLPRLATDHVVVLRPVARAPTTTTSMLFLPPEDVFWSFAKVLVFARRDHPDPLLLRLHAPAAAPPGVGVGRRDGRCGPSIVAVAVLDFFLSLAIWGTTTTVRVAG